MSTIMRRSDDNVNQSDAGDACAGDDVLELIHQVMHQYRSQQYRVLRGGPHDITHMDSKVLGFFGHRPGATQSDLVAHTGRDKAQVARLIKGLRERGLLDGEPDPADRRNVLLSLTAQGRAVQRALQRQASALGVRAVAGLSDSQRVQLVALLRQLQANLTNLRDEG